MEASAFIKEENGDETPKTCRGCMSTCDVTVPNDEYGQYKFRKLSDCTGVQANLSPGVPSYLCTNCESRLDKIALVYVFNETQNTVKNEADISKDHLGHCAEQTVGTELLIKTEVTTPDAAHDLPLIQWSCTAHQVNGTHECCGNHPDDLFEAEENPIAIKVESEDVDEPNDSHPPATTNTCVNNSASESIRNGIAAIDAGKSVKKPRSSTLKNHLGIHTGEKPYVCEICEQRFSYLSNLTQHKKNHNKDKHFQCVHCPSKFAQLCSLKNHIRIHTGEKPYVCEVCVHPFRTSSNLAQHKKIHNKDQYFQCLHCPSKFKRLAYLNNHSRIHSGEKPFVCEVCDHAFSTSSNLVQHKKIHNKDQQHQCPHCPAKFAQSSNLTAHIRIHTGEKPYVCEVCDHAFRTSSTLARHKIIHKKDQYHQCPHCPSKYTQLFNLNNHIRTHTGEKPFVCNICNKAFHSSPALASHSKSHKKD